MQGQGLKQFDLGWRFCSEQHDPLPETEWNKIQPIRESESGAFWKALVSREGEHLMECNLLGEAARLTGDNGWGDAGDEEKTRILLRETFPREDETPVLVFWHACVSVLTRWLIFVRYWPNFFYPSDESGVVACLDHPTNLLFVGDLVFVHDRSRRSPSGN
jgi:hypothetical protein